MIEVSELSKCYRLFDNPADRLKQSLFRGRKQFYKEFWPVQNVSFRVDKAEVVGLIGANGSGKSTILQLICGVLQPTKGSITTEGRIAALLELGSGFNPEFTGHDNLIMNASLLGLTSAQIEERYQEIVDFSGIGDFIYQPVKHYSSGMVVRLAFAISSYVDADILVVDEALAVGDAGFQAKCLERIERLMQQGTTVLLVTHDMQLIKRYCDRVIYLKKGQIAYDGDPEEGTEIYLAETKETDSANKAVTRNRSTTGAANLAFGTGKGAITEAQIVAASGRGSSVVVKQGERVQLVVKAKITTEFTFPRIQMTVRDSRGYNLFGFNNIYGGKKLTPDTEGNLTVMFSFEAALQAGDYAITLRLDDCDNTEQVNLVDKQVGIVDFTVTTVTKQFDAVIDLKGRCEEIE